MEKVEREICLDTDSIIGILNNEERAEFLIEEIKDCKIFITSINLFELLLREKNLEQIELFRSKAELLDFDEKASRKASEIVKGLKKKGKTVEFRDVFIASVCIINEIELVSFNRKDFDNIQELKLF